MGISILWVCDRIKVAHPLIGICGRWELGKINWKKRRNWTTDSEEWWIDERIGSIEWWYGTFEGRTEEGYLGLDLGIVRI